MRRYPGIHTTSAHRRYVGTVPLVWMHPTGVGAPNWWGRGKTLVARAARQRVGIWRTAP